MNLDAFGRAYLQLVLEIEKHIPGYIDAYVGPPALKAEVAAGEKQPAAALREQLAQLETQVPTADPARADYLRATLRAIGGTLGLLQGEKPAYLDEVAALFDIQPAPVNEEQFTQAHRELDTLLPGKGDITRRTAARQKVYELPAEKTMPIMALALQEVRRRSAEFVALPAGESIELRRVQNRPWGAYNWYLGNGQSLVEFNVDVPVSALRVLSTMAHEGYPGHHTEALLKEAELWQRRGYAEQAAFLLHSPAAVIAEGIATTALEIVFPDNSHHAWNLEVLLPEAGIYTDETAEQMARIAAASEKLRYVTTNAAYFYHSGRLSRDETLEYIQTYRLDGPERAAKSFSFFTNPLFSSYIFTYTIGYDLIAGRPKTDKTTLFRRLLTEQVLPSQLAGQHNRENGNDDA